MTSLTKGAVQAILSDALDVVGASGVTGDLRPVAFGKAVDLLSGGAAARPRDNIPSAETDGSDDVRPTGDERMIKIAKRMGVDVGKLAYVYELDDDVTLVVPRSKLPSDKTNASREVALLYAAARQAGGYDAGHTSSAQIRERVVDMGVFDSNNFAAKLAAMKDWFAMKGKGQKREFKVTQTGYEEAGKIVARIKE